MTMLTAGQQTLARIEAPTVLVDQISQEHPRPTNGIIEERLYTISLQQSRRHSLSVGRYCTPSRQSDFRDIGRLVVLPAFVPLEIRASGGLTQSVRCLFKRETIREYSGEDDFFDRDIPASCLNLRHRGITDMLARLGQELHSPGLASTALAEALGTAAIIEFIRYLDDLPKQTPFYRGGLSHRQFRLITEAIEGPENCPSLSDLSELMGLSVRHLTRAFKQTTGQTIYAHIEDIRFQKAQALLGDTDILIKTVAHRLGFSCSGAFCNAFRRMAGETPQAYRKRVRGTKSSTVVNAPFAYLT
jgi:AraC family transcriptional regulator